MVATISRKLTWRKCIWLIRLNPPIKVLPILGDKKSGTADVFIKVMGTSWKQRASLIPTNVQDRIVFVDANLIALLEQVPSGPLFWCGTFSHPKSLAAGGNGWAISQDEDNRKTRGNGGISKLQPLGRSLKTHPPHHLNVSNLWNCNFGLNNSQADTSILHW